MQDKLEEEDIIRAKKKLHSKMMDFIENWLNKKTISIRTQNIRDVRIKTDKSLQYHTKNYFVDTGLEKHLKWFSRSKALDVQGTIIEEMERLRKKTLIRKQKEALMKLQNRDEIMENDENL